MQVKVSIIANGIDVSAVFKGRLLSLSLTDEIDDAADMLEITLDNRDGRIEIPERGAVLSVSLDFNLWVLIT